MRLSPDEFEDLYSLNDFTEYYESLTVAELMDEIDRLHSDGPRSRTLFQNCAMYRRLTEAACFDTDLNEHQRNVVISVTTGLRETIESVILPLCAEDMQERVRAALAGTDDYVSRFGSYPRAAMMIVVGARKPSGPYDVGVVGEILAKS